MLPTEVGLWWNQSSLAHVKRAVEIAANGKHSLLITSDPASGKSAMLKVLAELQETQLETDCSKVWVICSPP